MKKLIVLIDMDDTIEELIPAWVASLNSKFGTAVLAEDICDWDIKKFFPSIPAEELFGVLGEEGFWETVNPKPGAVEYVKKMIDDGHKVFIVTSSYYKTIAPKMERVLFRHFPYLNWNDVIVTSRKQVVCGDVLIDDGVHNHIGGSYLKLLMDTPHNRRFNAEQFGMVRVRNWAEIYQTVTEYAQLAGKEDEQ